MTLNITIVTPKRMFQTGDFRLTDAANYLPLPNLGKKSQLVMGKGWSILIAFSGVAAVGTLYTGEWLESIVAKAPLLHSFEEFLAALSTADTWLRRVPRRFDRRLTFTVAGFDHYRPVLAMVSNHLSLSGVELPTAGPNMVISRSRVRTDRLLLAGSGAKFVSEVDRYTLLGAARGVGNQNPLLEYLAEINRSVSGNPTSFVGPGCFTTWVEQDGHGGGRTFEIPAGQSYIPLDLMKFVKFTPNLDEHGNPIPIQVVQIATQILIPPGAVKGPK